LTQVEDLFSTFGQWWIPRRRSMIQGMGMVERQGGEGRHVHVLVCTECPRVSSMTARGWRAYRVDDPEAGDPPALAFYCPECAEEIFS
jgi:hypothetical protein